MMHRLLIVLLLLGAAPAWALVLTVEREAAPTRWNGMFETPPAGYERTSFSGWCLGFFRDDYRRSRNDDARDFRIGIRARRASATLESPGRPSVEHRWVTYQGVVERPLLRSERLLVVAGLETGPVIYDVDKEREPSNEFGYFGDFGTFAWSVAPGLQLAVPVRGGLTATASLRWTWLSNTGAENALWRSGASVSLGLELRRIVREEP
ncbi:MAG TPA: hypothetical protein P5571_12050 [Candidatus Krumholzibacteria bacterium]|nr:hypothetical protein [Candidatus Krumholzibacteria bacterium]HRX52091.1 hypothetical protein [Candidatus Krumholzibacteria bacterium]